ncbi:hypothetical protein LSCM1_01361 [Leishmania martiniquensis]|uniref:Uncharacterized protein n=1 Tax=Leishmania martiniquensis TaxID=1580590 RepID=A0A836GP16_9TRYP|nr:hypothetical protein LSCM1_01361 [Leishmania martiniquensis]
MPAAGAPDDSTAIPLQLAIDYVEGPRDACFSWLKNKYASIKPAAGAASADRQGKKPRIDSALLQQLENDVVACDELRWRVFSFPSHPIRPLNVSYRHDAGRKAGAPATVVEMHRTKRCPSNSTGHTARETEEPYALVIRTRADSDAKRRLKTARRKAQDTSNTSVAAASGAPTPRVEELLEKVVREEKQAYWCRVLGEEHVDHETPRTSTWADRWITRSWRPLLGGYVSAPSRIDQARFLIFPQSRHPAVDTRDPKALSNSPETSLDSPQSVPGYLRGSVRWEVEESNPAAGALAAARPTHDEPSGASATRGGLHHNLTYACIHPATAPERRNWADVVEVSAAYQQSRTERQYAPERAKVQRVTLLEDSVAVKTSQGNPRHSTLISATRSAVLNSGVKHQCAVSPSSPTSKRLSHKAETPTVPDDALLQLRVEEVYDSSVQHFALPRIWQRWMQPGTAAAFTSEPSQGTGSNSLDDTPRGFYRMRWSGGPGVELCKTGGSADGADALKSPSASSSLMTIFGRLWSESWVQVPLSSRWTLTLRNQSAMVLPLEPRAAVAPEMVCQGDACGESVAATPSAPAAHGSWMKRVCTHPYFWATQGPRWDAALVRGFKNDFNGLHHARRWYVIVSAELTLIRGKQTGNSARDKISYCAGAPPPDDEMSTDGVRGKGVAMDEESVEEVTSATRSRRKGTSLTAFANACVVDTVRDYPRASVGFSFISHIPRLAITPFNEIVPRTFECSLSWFAALRPRAADTAGGKGRAGFGLKLQSGLSPLGTSAAGPATTADGMPLLRVSPVETFQHVKCGLTWRFDN